MNSQFWKVPEAPSVKASTILHPRVESFVRKKGSNLGGTRSGVVVTEFSDRKEFGINFKFFQILERKIA